MEHKPPNQRGSREDLIVKLYHQDGLQPNQVAKMVGCAYSTVMGTLHRRGIPIRKKGVCAPRGSDHPSCKLTAEELNELESELMAGRQKFGDLGIKYGLSRERVRQIAKRLGAPTGRQIQAMTRIARAAQESEAKALAAQARKEARLEKYQRWQALWDRGLTVPEMAAELGMTPGSVSVRIVMLRRRFPDWFQLRRQSYGTKAS
jgi:transposase